MQSGNASAGHSHSDFALAGLGNCLRAARACSLVDELLQLGLDLSIAHLLVLKEALGVDGEGSWDCLYSEGCGDRAIEAAIAILCPGHAILCDEALPGGLVLVEADADDDQRLAFELFGDLFQMWQRLLAWAAPCGPEIDEHYFAGEAAHR